MPEIYDMMPAADLQQANLIYTQLEATVQKQQSEQWVLMTADQSKVFTIDATSQQVNKPTAWVPMADVNDTIRMPLGFTAKSAWRLKYMLNHLP